MLTEKLGFDAAVDYKADDWREQLKAATPDGIDVDFENVGGEIMDAVFARLNIRSRVALCGLISGYNEERAAAGPRAFGNLLIKRVLLQGFIVLDHFRRRPRPWPRLGAMADGKLKPLETVVEGFEQLPETDQHAVRRRERGQARRARRRRLTRPRQSEGHGRGLELPGRRQASTRAGARPRRTRKRVYLPMVAGLVTNSSITVPARSRRSRRRKRSGLSSGTTVLRR